MIASLTHMSLLSTAFKFQRKNWKASGKARKRYLDWALGSIVDPFLEFEPRLADTMARHVASLIAILLHPDPERPEATPELLGAVALDYLRAFPKPWQDRIKDHESLRDSLGIIDVENVSVGKGLDFLSSVFFDAIAKAMAKGSGSAPLRNGRGMAEFRLLSGSDDPDNTGVTFEIRGGGQIIRIKDEILGLLSESRDTREAIIRRNPNWFDMPRPKLDAFAVEVASEPVFAKRRSMVGEQKSLSVLWRLGKLGGQIADEGRSDLEYLAPPAPEAMRRYLRWPDSAATNGLSIREQAAISYSRLRSEFDPIEAIMRLSGAPFDIEEDTVAVDWETVDIDPAKGVTPLFFARAVRAARRLGLRREGLDFPAMQAIFSSYAPLFLKVLALSFRAAQRSAEWRDQPEPLRSVFLWVHANAVTGTLMACRIKPAETGAMLSRYFASDFRDAFDRRRKSRGLIAEPADITVKMITSTAVLIVIDQEAAADRTLTEEEVEIVKDMIGEGPGDIRQPSVEILLPSGDPKSEGTWFENDFGAAFMKLGVFDLPPPYKSRDSDTIAKAILSEMSEEVGAGPTGFWTLLLLIDPRQMQPETRQMLVTAFKRGLAADVVSADRKVFTVLVTHLAQAYAVDHRAEEFAALLAEVSKTCMEVLGRGIKMTNVLTRDRADADMIAALFEACFSYSAATEPDIGSCLAKIGQMAVVIVDSWPGSLLGVLTMLEGMVAKVPVAASTSLWDVILRLRSR